MSVEFGKQINKIRKQFGRLIQCMIHNLGVFI